MSIWRTFWIYSLGSHGSDYEEYNILVYDGKQSGRTVMFCMILLPPASGKRLWYRRQQAALKQQYTSNRLHTATAQMAPGFFWNLSHFNITFRTAL